MNYREIVSVTGAGGLFQLVGSKGDGALLRQIGENTVKFFPARKHSITQLETIEVYTTEDNVPLHDIFRSMQQQGGERPSAKAGSDEIKGYFKSVYPALDEDRVYVSDMKKMLKWYDILEQNNLLEFPEPGANNNEDAEAPDVTVVEEAMVAEENKPDETDLAGLEGEAAGSKPAKKTATKKAAAKKATATGEAAESEAAPKKKTARKKKEEE